MLPRAEQAVKMHKVTLTERFVTSPKRVPRAGRTDAHDAVVPGLALRTTSNGHRSFVLIARYPLKPKNPTRRTLGEYGTLTLEQAREKAREWLALIAKGMDPKINEARRKAEEQRRQVNTFAAMWHAFFEQHASKLAKADEAKRAGTVFVKVWGGRPVTDIEPMEIGAHITAIAKETPAEARNRLGHLSRAFTWAIGTGGFALVVNPCAVLRPRDLIGKKVLRNRILADDELRAVWGAAAGLGYPYGPVIRLLVLSGQRVNECAGMSWNEIDLDQLWTIPAARMKADRAHIVPLAPDALALLESLPRWSGPYVFTTTGGAKPINGFSKAKERLDKLSGVRDWVLHDIRRTVRTHFSALPVQDMVRELVIAHARPGLHQVYDQWSYLGEKRECLALWEHRLRGILAPQAAGCP
jgi:integrase